MCTDPMNSDHKQNLETLQSFTSERPQCMPNAAEIHYLNVCHSASGKIRSRSAKKQRLQPLPHICHSANMNVLALAYWNKKAGK